MKSVEFALVLAIVAISASCRRPAMVQEGARAGPPPMTSTGGCTGLPYSAKQIRISIKTLADGTTTEQKQVQLVWRDAEDRTRTEVVGRGYDFIAVNDPVERAHWSWSVNPASAHSSTKKLVHVWPFVDREGPVPCQVPLSQQGEVRHSPAYTIEKLPPTTINGVPVLGHRITRVFSSGADDNKHQFTQTTEFWISPDLGVLVREVLDDPRTGKIITELSEVRRDTPDPALFKMPEGYEIWTPPPPTPSLIDDIMKSIKPVLPQPPTK